MLAIPDELITWLPADRIELMAIPPELTPWMAPLLNTALVVLAPLLRLWVPPDKMVVPLTTAPPYKPWLPPLLTVALIAVPPLLMI